MLWKSHLSIFKLQLFGVFPGNDEGPRYLVLVTLAEVWVGERMLMGWTSLGRITFGSEKKRTI